MVSLVDIGPLSEEVPYRGQKVPVTGLPAIGIFELLKDIPQLRKLMAERSLTNDDMMAVVQQVPHAVAVIIVMGMGNSADDKKEMAMAMKMTAGEQALFLSAIMRMTFPQGVTSFVESLTALLPATGALGWDRATKSQEPSSNASAPDTQQANAGDTPQGN
jgi:hypothetical protein